MLFSLFIVLIVIACIYILKKVRNNSISSETINSYSYPYPMDYDKLFTTTTVTFDPSKISQEEINNIIGPNTNATWSMIMPLEKQNKNIKLKSDVKEKGLSKYERINGRN